MASIVQIRHLVKENTKDTTLCLFIDMRSTVCDQWCFGELGSDSDVQMAILVPFGEALHSLVLVRGIQKVANYACYY